MAFGKAILEPLGRACLHEPPKQDALASCFLGRNFLSVSRAAHFTTLMVKVVNSSLLTSHTRAGEKTALSDRAAFWPLGRLSWSLLGGLVKYIIDPLVPMLGHWEGYLGAFFGGWPAI